MEPIKMYRGNMKTAKALSDMYKAFDKEVGPILARETLISVIHIVIEDLVSSGLDVSPELLEERLTLEAKKIEQASKKIVA